VQDAPTVSLIEEGTVATVIINRPDSLNALSVEVLQNLYSTMALISSRPEIRVVLVRGEGDKAFVAGADVKSIASLGARAIAEYVELGQRTMRAIELCPVPIIALVNGYALGGGMELALACDLIFASETARFGQPEVNLGIIPGFGGTQRLQQRAGVGIARLMCFSGELLEAQQAYTKGIVDKIFPSPTFFQDAHSWCAAITDKAPLAVKATKRAIRSGYETSLLAGLRREVEEFLHVFSSEDREEGLSAFMQKRKPTFKGR
jgi:enoyl-CoA hydratase